MYRFLRLSGLVVLIGLLLLAPTLSDERTEAQQFVARLLLAMGGNATMLSRKQLGQHLGDVGWITSDKVVGSVRIFKMGDPPIPKYRHP